MKTVFLHGATYRADGQPDTMWTKEVKAKETPLWWQEKGLSFTSTGYGSRIPTRYKVFFNGRWRRVYCRIYSNTGTLYIGKLCQVGERIRVEEGAER